ncbi:MAG: sulfurtransferase [Gammaproteobacteria bacterium]|nr:sulfurtransferase [Gammaproteobacteria bacterium]
MSTDNLPLLIEPDILEESLGYDNLLIVDLSKPDNYRKLHVPGAVHLDYAQIVAMRKPVMGLLPDDDTLEKQFSALGIDTDTHVVAYDDEGGGRAARLLWTLETAGHERFSLLNGGLHAWANEGHRYDNTVVTPVAKSFVVQHRDTPIARSDYIREHLGDSTCCLLDVRSPDEYLGVKKYAERAGHIPGAVNMEWTQAIDAGRNLRFKPDTELTALLDSVGATPDKQVICYCQTHHRSAHTYLVLKQLGYPDIKGYPGSWSDWGNDPSLPVE